MCRSRHETRACGLGPYHLVLVPLRSSLSLSQDNVESLIGDRFCHQTQKLVRSHHGILDGRHLPRSGATFPLFFTNDSSDSRTPASDTMSSDHTLQMEAGTIASSGADTDEVELARMGYKQELK